MMKEQSGITLTSIKGDPKIAHRLNRALSVRNLSNGDLSRLLNVTTTAVGNWINCKSAISIPRIEQIARVLEISPAYLAFGEPADEGVEILPGESRIPEYAFEDTTSPVFKRNWVVSNRFLDKGLRKQKSSLFLFENTLESVKGLKPGSMLFVDEAETVPEVDGAGKYLVFFPFTARVEYITPVYDEGLRYQMANYAFDALECKILGRYVGVMHSED